MTIVKIKIEDTIYSIASVLRLNYSHKEEMKRWVFGYGGSRFQAFWDLWENLDWEGCSVEKEGSQWFAVVKGREQWSDKQRTLIAKYLTYVLRTNKEEWVRKWGEIRD